MLKGLGDIGNLMKLQKEMKNIQKKLKAARVEDESNDGNVKAGVNGEFGLVDLSIDPEFLASGDAKKIEKSVMSAVNNAVEKMKQHSAEEMSSITGGLNIPGLN
ncbi:MAG: YbaB/EbfC family nucleoid-associated protein [Spirochaetia bacterium]|jgi:DNA-binding YbaB/EbfC family protein|nr:YbaB/EbfC family nucleoid-associated protein [Spirochaetia bacterium]